MMITSGHRSSKIFYSSITLTIIFSFLFLLTTQKSYAASVVASSFQAPNEPNNVLDGDINTRWSAKGDGQWFTVDLGSERNLVAVKLAFHQGDQRVAYFDISTSPDNGNFTPAIMGASSSGTTLWNQTFSFPQRPVRYIRYVGYGNSSGNNWNSVTKFSTVKGTSPDPEDPQDPGDPEDCRYPSDVLELRNWKITIPYTSATGDTDGNTRKAAEILQPNLATYERSPEFTNVGCDYVQFRAHAGGATTNGSGYPRSELREMTADGSDEIEWDSDTGTHMMEVKLAVTQLPNVKKHITIAQIHDGDDDIMTFRLEDKKIRVEIDGDDGPIANKDYVLGTPITLKFVVSNNQTRAYYNNTLITTYDKSYDDAYFKAGAYTQSACGGNNDVDGESCSAYGEVRIFDLSVSHQ